mgnify:FL=1
MRKWLIGIITALILLAGLAFWIKMHTRIFDQARHFQTPTLPTSMLDLEREGDILKKTRLVAAGPNTPENYPDCSHAAPLPDKPRSAASAFTVTEAAS